MATTAVTSRSSSPNPNVVLRAARLEAQKKQFGRTAPGNRRNLSTLPAQPSRPPQEEEWLQRSPVARMRADRHAAQRYANPGASTPRLQEISNSLRNGDTNQEEDANEIEEQEGRIADENDQAQSLQSATRARSRAKAASRDASQKMMEHAKRQFEKTAAQAKSQLMESGGSLLDEGECLEVVDTIATGKSLTRVALSFFQDGMSEGTKSLLEKLDLPVYKMSDPVGVPSAASTAVQAGKWVSVLFFLIPFVFIFLFLAGGSFADIAHGNVKNALTLLRGSL